MERMLVLGGGMTVTAVQGAQTDFLETAPGPMAATDAFFNVVDYGTHGDGIQDDTHAIQDAIDAAAAAGGGIVLLPAGLYLVGGTLNITTNGITIFGANTKAATIKVPNSAPTTVHFTACTRKTVRNVNFYSTGRSAGASIVFDGCGSTLVEDVDMVYQFIGVQVNGGSVHRINRGYWILSQNGSGIILAGNVPEVHISRISLDANATAQGAVGLNIQNANGVWVDSCDFIHCFNGLLISPGAGQNIDYCHFSNTAWDSSSSRCILISATAANSTIHGLYFSNCWSATCTYDTCVVTGNVDGCCFVEHKFLNSTNGNGLWVSGPAKNIYVDNCVASGITVGNAYCFVGNATDFAVRNSFAGVMGSTGNASFAGNSIGLRVLAGCNNYVITGNVLRGNTSSNLMDQGGPNKVVGMNLLT